VTTITAGHRYAPRDAFSLIRAHCRNQFDESVDVAVRLLIDPRRSDQVVRGVVELPHGTGRRPRIAVAATGDSASRARGAGAALVADGRTIAEHVAAGQLGFDVLIATPAELPALLRVGKKLGPRGLLPNVGFGTLAVDVVAAITQFAAGHRVRFRTDRDRNVHVPIGRVSFSIDQLVTNYDTLLDAIWRVRPAAARGSYVSSVAVSTTMGPSVRIDPSTDRQKMSR
jgi:large subunit ribosomal protein L1